MNRNRLLPVLLLFVLFSSLAYSQTVGDKINLYFADWHNASTHTLHGTLQVRDIFTRGDALNPTTKGAVLRYLQAYGYATLAAHASTKTEALERQQEIYFVESGRGVARAAGKTTDLHRNIAILVPAGLTFGIENTGDVPLTAYYIAEPIPSGFRPNAEILARDENEIPISSSSGMWAHIVKPLFTTADGLGTLEAVLTVTLDPLTIGKPHPVPNEDSDQIEEIWTALDGTSLAMVGNELRRQPPGMSYLHIPDNKTPHTNINPSEDTPDRFLYVARYRDHEVRK